MPDPVPTQVGTGSHLFMRQGRLEGRGEYHAGVSYL